MIKYRNVHCYVLAFGNWITVLWKDAWEHSPFPPHTLGKEKCHNQEVFLDLTTISETPPRLNDSPSRILRRSRRIQDQAKRSCRGQK